MDMSGFASMNKKLLSFLICFCCLIIFGISQWSAVGRGQQHTTHWLTPVDIRDDNSLHIIAQKIVNATKDVATSHRLWSNGESNEMLKGVYSQLVDILTTMGYPNELQRMEQSLGSQKVNKPSDVCQEKYVHKDISKSNPKYIFYRRVGFYMENCTDVPEFNTLLTLVYNFVHYNSSHYNLLPDIIREANRLYPKINIIAAVPPTLSIKEKDFENTKFITVQESEAEPDIWNRLTAIVGTKYVYIGRNVIHFTWFDRLERLVREINNLEASVVASAYRTLKSGQWSNGCEQSVLSNYMLVYRHGYDVSMQECLVCHHVHGPFVAKTELLRKNPLPSRITSTSAFAIWFLKLKKLKKKVVSCPDSMAFVTDESRLPTRNKDWKDLASSLQVEHIRLNREQVLNFSCSEAKTSCPATKAAKKVTGKALSICCKKEVSDTIKLVMTKCREGGMVCQLNAGTSLGAVKFNSIIPWDNDADILIHPNNVTAFKKLQPYFTKRGFTWNKVGDGYFHISTSYWTVEIFADSFATSLSYRITPTVVDLDGTALETTVSPGLFSRNMYGAEMYQHVQHWRHIGLNKQSVWDFYNAATKKFSRCPTPGHHACLDQFIPDGNLIFQEPVL